MCQTSKALWFVPLLLALHAASARAQTTVPVSVITQYNGLYFYVDSHSYNVSQQFQWAPGSTHTLGVLSPQYSCGGKYTFTGWSTGGPMMQTVTAPASPVTYMANYSIEYGLTLAVSPASAGTVTPSIVRPENYYPSGTILQVTATPAAGYEFVGWTGEYSGTANPLTIQMNGFRAVTAIFHKIGAPTVTVTTNPPGYPVFGDQVQGPGPQSFDWAAGSTHTISTQSVIQVSDSSRYVFSSWSDAGPLSHAITAGSAPSLYTANLLAQVKLSITTSPPAAGTITLSQGSDGWLDQASSVALTAVPAPGYRFAGWSGDSSTKDNPFQLLMDTAHNITANFVPAAACSLTFRRPGTSLASFGDTGRIDVVADAQCPWAASSDAGWFKLTAASGTGNGAMQYAAEANASGQPRTAHIQLSSGSTYSIVQAAYGCGFQLDSGSLTVAADGGPFASVVGGTPNCRWSASAAPDWITVVSGEGQSGGSLHFTVAPNSGGPRTGSVVVAGQTLKILQKGPATPVSFTDVTSAHPFFDYIQLLNRQIPNAGCTASTFCPDAPTTRSQMAVWIIQSLFGDSFSFSAAPYFSDVPSSHPQFRYIQKMKDLGITSGCTLSTYCPNDAVTRGQMAAFLMRARMGVPSGQSFPYPASAYFSDVPAADLFFSYIQKLREAGITNGCSAAAYCAEEPTTRGQMAVFVVRTFFTP
ncbi:MAG: S-layer homology domain-containing protein [Bryobacterales bacterium]|nr:S-layer homology domain-containing protein [Bryobacterales bacterium]